MVERSTSSRHQQAFPRSRDPARLARRTVASIHAAERELQSESFAPERRQALAALDAGLRSLHASKVAAVVSRFADRRVALSHMTDVGARAAESQQIAQEEANEMARLSVEHAAEKRRMRSSVLGGLRRKHWLSRRNLRRRQRHQRMAFAVQLQAIGPAPVAGPASRARIRRRQLVKHPVDRH